MIQKRLGFPEPISLYVYVRVLDNGARELRACDTFREVPSKQNAFVRFGQKCSLEVWGIVTTPCLKKTVPVLFFE